VRVWFWWTQVDFLVDTALVYQNCHLCHAFDDFGSDVLSSSEVLNPISPESTV
jgi:hypothetical protein